MHQIYLNLMLLNAEPIVIEENGVGERLLGDQRY